MFGYIHIAEKELSDQEKRIYHAYYCGLCQYLKKEYGILSQMLVNYDMTFLIILLSGLYRLHSRSFEFVCPVHPGKKKMATVNDATRYAASMSVLLSYYALSGSQNDDRSHSRKVVLRLLEKNYSSAAAEYPEQDAAMKEYYRQISLFEENKEQNMDVIAGLTGDMFARIYSWRDDHNSEELSYLGYHIGKFIYLMDAYKDLDKDSRKNEYNPLITMDVEHPKDRETFSRLILNSLISECARSYERLSTHANDGIVRNILYYGVWEKYETLHLKRMKRQERNDKRDQKINLKKQKNEIRDLRRIERRILKAETSRNRKQAK